MTALSIGLLGSGRVGRNLIRILSQSSDLELAAVVDPSEREQIEYLLRFDTLLGRFPGPLHLDQDDLVIGERRVVLRAGADAELPDWRALGVDVVVFATGKPVGRAEIDAEIARGAGRIVLCSPPAEPPDATIVFGVNEETLRAEHRVVSVGSVTAVCIAPILQIFDRQFGVDRAFLTTVHAYGTRLALADAPADDMRSGRAAAENIIPQQTNADELIAELIPSLAGKVSGLAMNVPVPNGSVLDLTCWHPRDVTAEEINAAVRAAAEGALYGLIDYEVEPIVSSDIVKSPSSGTFDSLSTMVVGGRISKTLTFYDNAWGYAHRVVDLLRRLAAFAEEETQG